MLEEMPILLVIRELLLDAKIAILEVVILAIDDTLICIKELELRFSLSVVLKLSSDVVDGWRLGTSEVRLGLETVLVL